MPYSNIAGVIDDLRSMFVDDNQAELYARLDAEEERGAAMILACHHGCSTMEQAYNLRGEAMQHLLKNLEGEDLCNAMVGWHHLSITFDDAQREEQDGRILFKFRAQICGRSEGPILEIWAHSPEHALLELLEIVGSGDQMVPNIQEWLEHR